MKVIIAGCREGINCVFVESVMDWYVLTAYPDKITEVVSGTANGVDKFGEKWADELDIPVRRFPAYWDIHGKAAGPIRNEEMAKYADQLIAFWDGESRGTKNMIENMKKLGKPVTVITLQKYNMPGD